LTFILTRLTRTLPRMLTANLQPIPILVYHQIDVAPSKGRPFRSLYVSPGAFARQMRLLALLGYKGLSMSGLTPYLTGEKKGRVVGLTFDDGYVNNLSYALPVLMRHGFSSTCYAVSGLAGKTNLWDKKIGIAQTPLMDPAKMRSWVAGGQEIGSHTANHQDLTQLDDEQSESEIMRGKADLETMLMRPPEHFCYPYGKFENRHVEMVRAGGFRTSTTTRRGRCHGGIDLLELPRVPVLRSTSLPVFLLKIGTAYEDRRKA
jgi:peptidoglycan/xylan/chitin deacetylase (PgdA/CDA1 family)